MDWTQTLVDVIDFRSFSSLWYWIVLAVVWSSASHWVLGVPFDLIMRARRHGGEAAADMRDLVRINVNRILHIVRVAGLWLVGAATFVHSALLVLAAWYRVEFAQAILFLALPMTLVGALGVRTAERIAASDPDAEDLIRRLLRHRFGTQAIGMVSIFVTAMFGMYHNLAALRAW